MGWASYLEDIVSRLNDDLRQHGVRLRSEGWSDHLRAESESLLRRCESLVSEILSRWSYATDPSLDMAHALALAKNERTRAVAELQRAEDEVTALRSELALEKKGYHELQKQLRESKRENRRLIERLDSTFEQDPGRIYDMYPPKRPKDAQD